MTLTQYRAGEVPPDFPTPDVYFSSGYGSADEVATSSTWLLMSAHDGLWQLPILRTDRKTVVDAQSPYGYAGIYANPSLSERDVARAWDEARNVLADDGVVGLFLRRSPLVPQADPPDNAKWVVRDHPTRAVALSAQDTMWASMEGRCRTSIRKAGKIGLRAQLRPATRSALAADASFRRLYEDAMRRRGAAERYFFDDAYYEALAAGLGDRLLVGEVTDPEGSVVAAALFMRQGDLWHYHLSGGIPAAGSLGATNLLIWEGCKTAAESGARLLHLGGGIEARDSLYKFKRSFGGEELRFSAVGIVLDDAGYHAEVARRAGELNCSTADLLERPEFPAYRGAA